MILFASMNRAVLWTMLGLLIAVGLVFSVLVKEYKTDAAALPRTRLAVETAAGPVQFTVETATTREEQERGLMFRKSLARDAGMLFDFVVEKEVSFWMKDTYIPLDMVF